MTLCTLADYRRYTGDETSDASAIGDALSDAQSLLEAELDRAGVMESATRTEEVRVYNLQNTLLLISGLAYPKATPITAVTSPAGVTFTTSEIRGISGVTFDLVTDLIDEFPRATVTYVGGWMNSTYPVPLKRAQCLAARELVRTPSAVPVGATSVATGDVRVAFAKPVSPMTAVAAVFADPLVQRYRRRRPMR